jgi:hypothetical protein
MYGRLFCISLFFLPFVAVGQSRQIAPAEFLGGIGFSRPLNVSSDIYFQSGVAIELGGRYNFAHKSRKTFFMGLTATYATYNIEGFFQKTGDQDLFVRTADNVKVNSIILVPVAFDLGIQFEIKKALLAASPFIQYAAGGTRTYKIGNDIYSDDFKLAKKAAAGGRIGLGFLAGAKSRFDLVFSYLFSSQALNNEFHPLQISFRFGRNL